jgi:PAS domain S-box-containing protein
MNLEFGQIIQYHGEKLQEYNNSNLYKLSFERRTKTLINNMHINWVGQSGLILFANDEALKIIGLKSEEVMGKLVTTLALTNDLMKSLVIRIIERKQKSLPMKFLLMAKKVISKNHNITIKPTGEDQIIVVGCYYFEILLFFKELDFAKTNFIATVSHN